MAAETCSGAQGEIVLERGKMLHMHFIPPLKTETFDDTDLSRMAARKIDSNNTVETHLYFPDDFDAAKGRYGNEFVEFASFQAAKYNYTVRSKTLHALGAGLGKLATTVH